MELRWKKTEKGDAGDGGRQRFGLSEIGEVVGRGLGVWTCDLCVVVDER